VSEAHKRRRKQAFSFTAAMLDSSDDGLDLMRTRRRDAKEEDDKDLSSNSLGGDSEDDFYDSNAGEDGDNRADIDIHDTKKCKKCKKCKDMLDTQLNLATPEFPQKIELAKMWFIPLEQAQKYTSSESTPSQHIY
jgi:hypothetical protein